MGVALTELKATAIKTIPYRARFKRGGESEENGEP